MQRSWRLTEDARGAGDVYDRRAERLHLFLSFCINMTRLLIYRSNFTPHEVLPVFRSPTNKSPVEKKKRFSLETIIYSKSGSLVDSLFSILRADTLDAVKYIINKQREQIRFSFFFFISVITIFTASFQHK